MISESTIERHLVKTDKDAGGIAYKFVSPQNRAVPDRLRLREIPPEHREIVARYVRFAELKAPGKKPTPLQAYEHDRIRALGFVVDVIDSKEGVATFEGS